MSSVPGLGLASSSGVTSLSPGEGQVCASTPLQVVRGLGLRIRLRLEVRSTIAAGRIPGRHAAQLGYGKQSVDEGAHCWCMASRVRFGECARVGPFRPACGGGKGPERGPCARGQGIAWGITGAALDCFDTALEYGQHRQVFGRPLACRQLFQARRHGRRLCLCPRL
jgi:hypothetical protein